VGVALLLGSANLWVRHRAAPFVGRAPSDVRAPVAIVPGASIHRDGRPAPQLEARLALALILARQGRVERVLVSGARDGAYDEAGAMRRWLLQRGVAASRIIDDHAGYRTLDTMQRAARLYGVRRAVICTQAFHLPRAIFLARHAGIDAVGVAPDIATPDRSASDLVREAAATLVAVLDSYVLGRQPRQLALAPLSNSPSRD
jgi:SanA protein